MIHPRPFRAHVRLDHARQGESVVVTARNSRDAVMLASRQMSERVTNPDLLVTTLDLDVTEA